MCCIVANNCLLLLQCCPLGITQYPKTSFNSDGSSLSLASVEPFHPLYQLFSWKSKTIVAFCYLESIAYQIVLPEIVTGEKRVNPVQFNALLI